MIELEMPKGMERHVNRIGGDMARYPKAELFPRRYPGLYVNNTLSLDVLTAL